MPQQESENSCIQEARTVELHRTSPLVVGQSPCQYGGISFHVDQRKASDGAAVGFCAVIHKYTGIAKGNVEGGPDTEPCKSCKKEKCYFLSVHFTETF